MEVVIKLKKEELSRLNMLKLEAPIEDRAKSMRFLVSHYLHLDKEKDVLDLVIDGQRY
jgi:hypothetical protein